ncbi:armadillo-type protein [Polychytrium aggregatum]|uniref:armadillo-type protein n=1 Tax=Polychytrium aggregatum TaxID=110093 RepID=UPI0022FE5D1C|nr:armadillo-type protein [Polychytrium aggregatum]KAI9203339.1 armadillo-type protein [Polychytrium aggregatum]
MMALDSEIPAAGSAGPSAASTEALGDEIVQTLQRDINILAESSSDRAAKRRSLEKIRQETVKRPKKIDPEVLSLVFKSVVKTLLKCLGDPIERVRELAVETLSNFVEQVPTPLPFLEYILPTLVTRLGQPEIVETAEEVRLMETKLLRQLLEATKLEYSPFVDSTVEILARVLADPFPDVKKEACKVVTLLSEHCRRILAYHGGAIAKAIVPCLHHRHSAVRISGLVALEAAILVDFSGFDDLADLLQSLTLDKTSAVREQLYVTSAAWLTKTPDRYSIGYKILPLLLAGLCDEVPKLVELSRSLFDQVGALYEAEWEDRLKDELDYTPANSGRPRVGCRHLARDNTQKIVAKLVAGIQDWTAERRHKSALVLATFVTFTESNITGYIAQIVPGMVKVLSGDDAHVMDAFVQLATVIGRFVDPAVYLQVILPQVKTGGHGTSQFCIGCLRVLWALLSGSSGEHVWPHAKTITGLLGESELINSENMPTLLEVSIALKTATKQVGQYLTNGLAGDTETGADIAYGLFLPAVTLCGSDGNERTPGYVDMRKNVDETIGLLVLAHGYSDRRQLYARYSERILSQAIVGSRPETWTKHAPEGKLLRTVAIELGENLGNQLGLVMPAFLAAAACEDVDVRIALMLLLSVLLQNPIATLNSQGQLVSYSEQLLKYILLKNGIWKPGRKHAALRAAVVHALMLALSSHSGDTSVVGVVSVGVLNQYIGTDVIPVLISCLDEDEIAVRKDTLSCIHTLLNCSGIRFTGDLFRKLYPEIVKRLDDANDEIRIATCAVLQTLFDAVEAWEARRAVERPSEPQDHYIDDVKFDSVHWMSIVKILTIHMDDSNPGLQAATHAALQRAMQIGPRNDICEHLALVKQRHRSAKWIDSLLTPAQ